MRIKMLYCMKAIATQGMQFSFTNGDRVMIKSSKEPSGYVIEGKDRKTFIPMHNINEVVFEEEEQETVADKVRRKLA